jgi:hypothetical protein
MRTRWDEVKRVRDKIGLNGSEFNEKKMISKE